MAINDYINDVIRKGDKGSALLHALCAPTLENQKDFISIISDGMNGLAALKVPEGYNVAVFSAGGNPNEKNLENHTLSLVENLMSYAININAKPIAFANVVDSDTGDIDMLKVIGNALRKGADKYKLAIMNGENACLGPRVNCEANLSGTMIALLPKEKSVIMDNSQDNQISQSFSFKHNGVTYAVFDPEDKPVIINSDGVGTKTEFYERSGQYEFAIDDYMAMNLDDAVKSGAIAKVISGIVETRGLVGTRRFIPMKKIISHTESLAKSMDLIAILDEEQVGDRIKGYDESLPSYNISGSVVSVIDEERLKNPLVPKARDSLIALLSMNPNPRSNGITAKRQAMVDMFGEKWHETDEGRLFMQYLGQPSTIFYPIFKELVSKGLATSVYHMSGGSFDGKLAKPLAKHNLYVKINNLFQPDWRESAIVGRALMPAEAAYASFPMGNEAFITTSNPKEASNIIWDLYGLHTRLVGKLENNDKGLTGVKLIGIKGSNGEDVYFSGR
ncbi:MAG: hypothetical protein U9R34_03745 [Nanoarchaeota archaeon]|nr:hypothetical protein [Nanoarchaeota archaeon]